MSARSIEHYAPEALDDFRSLKGKGGHFDRGFFIAESEKIARKIFASVLEIPKALMTPEYYELLRPLIDARSDVTDVYLAPKSQMQQIIGYPPHQGVMLAVRLPPPLNEEVLKEWCLRLPEAFLVVAL